MACLKVSAQIWIKTLWGRCLKDLTTMPTWIWIMVTTTKALTITIWIVIRWDSHITWPTISRTITITIQTIIISITTMWKTSLKTFSSTSIALQTVSLMPLISCRNTLWTLLWELLSKLRLHPSQWAPTLSSLNTSISSSLQSRKLMNLSLKRAQWFITRHLIHTKIELQILNWSQRTRGTLQTRRQG